ncbi:MAG: adenosylcobinamide-phosphate synthase CbiB [Pyrinomonadaceae bacterium]
MISASTLLFAYVLDWLIGDPQWFPHPVRWIGRMIGAGERWLRKIAKTPRGELVAGAILVLVVVGTFGLGSWRLLAWIKDWNLNAAVIASVFLAATTIATKSLLDEAKAVRQFLQAGNLESARSQLTRIVGRDTKDLDEAEITRAAIETLAESSSDGIVAPMFYLTIGGVPAALAYKAINTLDSMIGHHGARYEYFGKCAARLDDVANFVPARLTAALIVLNAWTLRLDWQNAWRVLRRDGGKHKSPNAGRPEAAMAGALGVRLGGTNFYDGERHVGQYLGDTQRRLDVESFTSALRLTRYVSLTVFSLSFTTILLITQRFWF